MTFDYTAADAADRQVSSELLDLRARVSELEKLMSWVIATIAFLALCLTASAGLLFFGS